jgi:hypothetical protein
MRLSCGALCEKLGQGALRVFRAATRVAIYYEHAPLRLVE